MRALVACAVLAACHPEVTQRRGIRVHAPPGARWAWAELSFPFVKDHQEGGELSFGVGHDYEMAAVELVIEVPDGSSRTVTLESVFGSEGGQAREVMRRAWKLAASADGTWIGVSSDGGDTWRLVEPTTGMFCRHYRVNNLRAAVSPELLAIDILVASAGGQGPLHVEHAGGGGLEAWPRHPPSSELELASGWALAHDETPAVATAIVVGMFGVDDDVVADAFEPLVRAVRARIGHDDTMRTVVLRELATPRAQHLRTGGLAAELLWQVPGVDLQTALATWIEQAAPLADSAFEYGAMVDSDWSFARAVWDLARLVRRDGRATAQAEHAAAAVIATVGKRRHPRIHSYDGPDDPWSYIASPAAEASVSYAIQVLAGAKTPTARQVIEAADWNRTAPQNEGPLVDRDWVSDWRHQEDTLHGWLVPSWFHWASRQLADVH